MIIYKTAGDPCGARRKGRRFMHLDELRKYYKQVQVDRYMYAAVKNVAWYVTEWEKFDWFVASSKLEKYVELITLSRATLLMTIHGG